MNALLIVCGLGFVSLLAEIIGVKKGLHFLLIFGLLAATIAAVMEWGSTHHYFNNMLLFDPFATGFTVLILVVAIFWFGIFSEYFEGHLHQTDRSALVCFTLVGSIMMVSFGNLAILFLGLEILSISLYVLAGSNKESFFSNEAAFKYFIMGAFATGFLLMGIALVYGTTGSFDIASIADHVTANREALPGFFYGGVFLILIGVGFKMSIVPFHFWAPDVYSGAPTPITALMSTVVKIAAVATFYKLFAGCFLSVQFAINETLQVLIVLTLLVANVTAVMQNNVKRMLAFSSIAHVGYILLGFIGGTIAFEGILFYYLVAYAATSLAVFGILYYVENKQGAALKSFSGLYLKNPFIALCFTICLFSLAGIPPFAGFFAKYRILANAINGGHVAIVLFAVAMSLVGVYYYFKPVITAFHQKENASLILLPGRVKFLIGMLTIITVALGIFPDWVVRIFD